MSSDYLNTGASRRYWYFIFNGKNNSICARTASDIGNFPLTDLTRRMSAQEKCTIIIHFWREITENEYRIYNEYCREVDGGKKIPAPVRLIQQENNIEQ